jgi:hypothetical protein
VEAVTLLPGSNSRVIHAEAKWKARTLVNHWGHAHPAQHEHTLRLSVEVQEGRWVISAVQ